MVRRKKVTNDASQKSVVEPVFKGAQQVVSALLEQVEKHPATFDAMLEEVIVDRHVLEATKVQAANVITGLKTAEAEASGVPKEVVSEVVIEENQTTSDALEIDMKGINLNSILKDGFDYSTLNHISPTPSPNPSANPSPKHTSSPVQQSEPMVESPEFT